MVEWISQFYIHVHVLPGYYNCNNLKLHNDLVFKYFIVSLLSQYSSTDLKAYSNIYIKHNEKLLIKFK